MPNSCRELRDALAQCLQQSDCVMVQRHSAADCLREPLVDSLPPACLQLKRGFGECRRGLVDMRKRFRGNMPVSYKHMQEADQGKGYQLYAGAPAFATGARVTDGNEPEQQDWREAENEKYKKELAAAAAAERAKLEKK
ncbi:hypothetical protein TD95_001331 [Thielaviopsis punctulata]|uniref:Uncharacterized protein n=1 Tax=Thielaviopsis punctulata TaxID=72032 RepID=A0A0F4ZKA5_9PEZI|nr:hypothetical protein TD95_001331 [Thielaviopsis punctulata]